MKKNLLIIIAFLFTAALLMSGCAKSATPTADKGGYMTAPQAAAGFNGDAAVADESVSYEMEAPASEPEPAPVDDSAAQSGYQEKIIYNVSMSLECDNVDTVVDGIGDAVNGLGGYISYSNSYKSDGTKYASIQVKVPSDRLNEMIDYVKTLGDVPSEYMSTEDITDQYYDIVTRLENEQKQEEQLLELLDKAETIEDIILVRNELSTVQANIESYKGTIKMWDSLVDYSTVDISISPKPTINTDEKGIRLISLEETGKAMVKVFKESAKFVANAFSVLLRIITALIIPAAIIVPIVLLIVFLVKRSNRKKKQNKEQ